MKLRGPDRKLRVSTDWFLDLVLPPDIVQLKLEKSTSVENTSEPQEIIFRQADRGHLLFYVIVEGEVELFQQGPG